MLTNTDSYKFAAEMLERRLLLNHKYPGNNNDGSGLSIVIAVYNQLEYTKQCLQTLQVDVPHCEIIVVNNGSDESTTKWLREQQNITLLDWKENKGVAVAWNAGLRCAKGDVLGVLNNDTVVFQCGMQILLSKARKTGISAIRGAMLSPETYGYIGHTQDAAESDYAEGSCLLFTRAVWQDVGEFDEIFTPAYCEDSDWCLRAREKGYTWEIIPEAIMHYGNITSSTIPERYEWVERNQTRLKEKWKNKGVGEKICVKRIGGLGDCIMATSAISSLHVQKPLARIQFQCAPAFVNFFQDMPTVDLVASDIKWRNVILYDLTNVSEESDENNLFLHPVYSYHKYLNLPCAFPPYLLPKFNDESDNALNLLPRADYIACGVNSWGRPLANWGESQWIDLIKSMPDMIFVLFANTVQPNIEVNRQAHKNIGVYSLPNVIDLTGKTANIRLLGALMKRCQLCVSVDTGIFHIACGLKIPTVGLIAGAPGWSRAPFCSPVRILQGIAPCYPCVNKIGSTAFCTQPEKHCLGWVTTDIVKANLLSLMSRK